MTKLLLRQDRECGPEKGGALVSSPAGSAPLQTRAQDSGSTLESLESQRWCLDPAPHPKSQTLW